MVKQHRPPSSTALFPVPLCRCRLIICHRLLCRAAFAGLCLHRLPGARFRRRPCRRAAERRVDDGQVQGPAVHGVAGGAPHRQHGTGVASSRLGSSSLLPVRLPHLDGMVGNVGFDPMGLSTPQNIKWMREAELKHGRMAMLAWTVRRDTAEHCAPQAARAWPWPAPQRTAQYLGVARREELRLRNTRPTRGSRLSSNRCPLAAQGYVAVDLGIKFPGEKYAALTSYTAHAATAQQELFYALLFVGTAETIGFTQVPPPAAHTPRSDVKGRPSFSLWRRGSSPRPLGARRAA
eukprot:7093881-Prymnesium_polylepis.1